MNIFRKLPDPAVVRDKWVKNKLELIPYGQTIIDCGAGEQRYRANCSHLNYVSQDLCEFDGKAMAGLDKNASWNTKKIDIISDITDIPVENESYQNILCTEVLEHIPYPELAIKEFSRILVRGGYIYLTAPFCSFTHMAPYHFCTGFNKFWYESVLKKYGFEVQAIETYGNYFDFVGLDLRRLPNVCAEYSKKMNILQKTLITCCVWSVNKMSKYDRGSDEYATFGYMLLGRKVMSEV